MSTTAVGIETMEEDPGSSATVLVDGIVGVAVALRSSKLGRGESGASLEGAWLVESVRSDSKPQREYYLEQGPSYHSSPPAATAAAAAAFFFFF